VTEKKKKTNSI